MVFLDFMFRFFFLSLILPNSFIQVYVYVDGKQSSQKFENSASYNPA